MIVPKMQSTPGKRNMILTSVIIAVVLGALALLYIYAHSDSKEAGVTAAGYAEYESGTVLQILTDSCEADEVSEGAYRGEQTLLVEVTSGRYMGETLMVANAVGPLYGEPACVGQSVVIIVNTYSNGDHTATVYEYNRTPMVFAILALFVLVTVLVGGKTGAKSILGLILTVAMLLMVFLPLLMKGWDPIPTAFLLCSLVAIVCFVILGGCSKKVACACIGTIAGMALAMLFGLLAQVLLHLDGLRASYAEALLQLRQTGSSVQIRGLLVAGVIISALGAVMDVAMSIASALSELKTVNPQLTTRELWRSGMNIGRDMVGTMTNTLILAILGSSTVLILYMYSLSLSWHQFMASSYLGIEVIGSVSSAVGVILAVPLTALICAVIYGRRRPGGP